MRGLPSQFSRTAMLYDVDMELLNNRSVAVFGLGGVGGHCAEALCRSGIGKMGIIDGDVVDITNINRQIIATHKTVGMDKVSAMRERLTDINPEVIIEAHKLFYLPRTADEIDISGYDYIVDAVDTVTAKLELVCRAAALGIPTISSMGAANKLDPSALRVADIYSTSVCPMARVMRNELRKRGIGSLKVVYSDEKWCQGDGSLDTFSNFEKCQENRPPDTPDTDSHARPVPASNAIVPAVAGLVLASEVIKDLLNQFQKTEKVSREPSP